VRRPLVLAALVCATPASDACALVPADGALLGSGPVQLAWRAEPGPVQTGKPFVLQIAMCPADAVLTAVDAHMPEHRHGMNYRPTLQALGAGRWRAEGLLWHMAGRWELRFEVLQAGRAHTLRRSVELP
jgi:hypothetical protein